MANNRKKILITGAAGLIGRELCKQLSSRHSVIGVDNNFRYPDFRPDCSYIKEDLITYFKNSENTFDYIFHMSAINGTKYFYEIPNQVIENNVLSDLEVFKFAEKNKECKIIYASSSEVVAGGDTFPTDETNDIVIENIHNPRWSYRLGKILSENYLMNSDLNFLIVRFFNVFGPDTGTGHFVKDIIDKINRSNFVLHGADETRSFCHVEDAVDALIKIFDRVSKEVVNIGSDEEITVLEAATMIAKQKNKHVSWRTEPGKLGSTKRRKPSLDRLRLYYPNYMPRKFSESIKDL